jgi:hypothetical protein
LKIHCQILPERCCQDQGYVYQLKIDTAADIPTTTLARQHMNRGLESSDLIYSSKEKAKKQFNFTNNVDIILLKL